MDEESCILLLDLPTSYGKTSITISLSSLIDSKENYLFDRIIHVLPMRSIADELGNNIRDELMKQYGDGEKKVEKRLAVQHMSSPGSPFFAKRIIVTTLDTFILNFVKMPPHELRKIFKYNVAHFEFPRSMIYTSIVLFDEFHLFSPLGSRENERKSISSVVAAIKNLALTGVPVIVMTATMPNNLKNTIKNILETSGVKVIDETYKFGRDYEFDKRISEKKITVEECVEAKGEQFIEKVVDKALENINKGLKTMIIVNSVEKAVRIYRRLKGYALLLHGKLPDKTRKKYIERLENVRKYKDTDPEMAYKYQPDILVATQVIESGLNLSYDVLITESCPVDRLIQRIGRIARFKEHNNGRVIIIDDPSYRLYDSKVTEDTFNFIKEPEIGKDLSKKCRELLNKVYSDEYVPLNHNLFEIMFYLDVFPRYDVSYSKRVFEAYKGFTDNFGIITVFSENNLCREVSIGLSENRAKSILKKYRKVVEIGRSGKLNIVSIGEERLNSLLKGSLSLNLLKEGILGIAVNQIDEEVGLVEF